MNSTIIVIFLTAILQVANGLTCYSCAFNNIRDPPLGDRVCFEEPEKTQPLQDCEAVPGNITYCGTYYGAKGGKVEMGRSCVNLPDDYTPPKEYSIVNHPDGYDVKSWLCKTEKCNNNKKFEEVSTPFSVANPQSSNHSTSSNQRSSTFPPTPKSVGNSIDIRWRFEVGSFIIVWAIIYIN